MVRCKQCFNSLLFTLHFTSLKLNKTFPFSLECARSCWNYCINRSTSSALFLRFQSIVDMIYLGAFPGHFPPYTLLQYR